MPYKKAIAKKRGIPENIWKFLNDEHPDPGNDVDIFLLQEAEIRRLWDESKIEIMAIWISNHPGTRPTLWWRFDALEPRLRLGGKGQLISEKYPAVFQDYEKGILSGWHSIDEEDPPVFESQTAYLMRHDLLSPQEKKYLASHPELMDPEKIFE